MVYTKRLVISVILGMIAGLACAYLSKPSLTASMAAAMVPSVMCSIALNRTFIGFMIGISAWRMHWVLHGIAIGFFGSLPIAAPWIGQSGLAGFFIMMVAGMVWGFLIELLTTIVFKAPMRTIEVAKPAPAPAAQPAAPAA